MSCWSRRGGLGPSSPARRRILAAIRSPPTNHRRRPPATVHCHTQRRTSCWRRSSTPQVDLACSSLSTGSPLRSASDAIRAPLTALLKPDGCRAPPLARIAPPVPAIISASRARVGAEIWLTRQFSADPSVPPAPPPFRGASETERSQRSPSQNDTDVAGWRRVSCWSRRGALGPSSPARRRILAAIRSAPTNHRRRPPATVHCHTQRRTSCWRRSSTPQVDLACSSLSTGSPSAQRAMPSEPPSPHC